MKKHYKRNEKNRSKVVGGLENKKDVQSDSILIEVDLEKLVVRSDLQSGDAKVFCRVTALDEDGATIVSIPVKDSVAIPKNLLEALKESVARQIAEEMSDILIDYAESLDADCDYSH